MAFQKPECVLTYVKVGGVGVPIIKGTLLIQGIHHPSSLLPYALPLFSPLLLPTAKQGVQTGMHCAVCLALLPGPARPCGWSYDCNNGSLSVSAAEPLHAGCAS